MTNVKKAIFIGLGVLAVVVTGVLLYNKFKAPQGFNEFVERVKNKHPEIYAWWEGLDTSKQIAIENSMNQELLTFLNKELTKSKISDEAKAILKKAGYVG